MENIFKKSRWGNSEWAIYFNNLSILIKNSGMNKKDVNSYVGRWNLFRKNLKTRPTDQIVQKICDLFSTNIEWLGTPQDALAELKEIEKNYDLNGGWQPRPIVESTGFPAGHEIWRAYKLLHEIYESGDEVYIRAIFSNLVAFNNAVQQKIEMQHNKKRLADIEKTVRFLDRRSGKNRRQVVAPDYPADEERRSGIERRKTG